nr:Wzz/FepE/Etk N-terminal domain-containing protein [uncultured Gemmiger sp.]
MTNQTNQNVAMVDNEDYDTIDLLEVLNVVRQHILVVILTTVIAAVAGFCVSQFLLVPKYESSALMIVNTRQDATANVTSDQITSATKLVSTYSIIIKSDTVLQKVIDNLGLTLTYPELKDRVTVSAVDDTQVMQITVLSDNPEWARQVCEQITQISPDVILESVEAGSVKLISQASVPTEPVSPNILKNTAIAALLGLVLSAGIVILREMLDNRIKTEDDVRKYLDMPVIGVIPDFDMGGKR